MKKLLIIGMLLVVAPYFTACKSDKKKKEEPKKKAVTEAAYSLKKAKNKVDWVAYKTSEKVPVKGTFKTLDIVAGGEGNSIKEAINNAEFSVPVSSIFTSDISRDAKIIQFFFNAMKNTSILKGKIMIENDTLGHAHLTMNGITKKLPFSYKISDKEFSMNATMNLKEWGAEDAVKSLNKACKDLHTGTDGVSKTWDDVAINVSSIFK